MGPGHHFSLQTEEILWTEVSVEPLETQGDLEIHWEDAVIPLE